MLQRIYVNFSCSKKSRFCYDLSLYNILVKFFLEFFSGITMDFPHFLYSAYAVSCLASEQVASEAECCSYYVDFFIVASVEAAVVIM